MMKNFFKNEADNYENFNKQMQQYINLALRNLILSSPYILVTAFLNRFFSFSNQPFRIFLVLLTFLVSAIYIWVLVDVCYPFIKLDKVKRLESEIRKLEEKKENKKKVIQKRKKLKSITSKKYI